MLFVISGEGPSDLGSKDANGTLKKGAMTLLLDHLSNLYTSEMPDYELLTETDIKYRRKADRRNIGSKGVAPKNTEILWLDSRNLARYAKEKGNNVGLVYFKDSDGTNTAPRDRWNLMIAAMYSGFKAATFKWGVAMVPRPKSEAWLLAYYQKNDGKHQAYDHCARFEEMSGNDGSPDSCKALLKQWCNCDGNVYTDIITGEEIGNIDWDRINMPSFTTFKKRFENVLAGLSNNPYPHRDDLHTFENT